LERIKIQILIRLNSPYFGSQNNWQSIFLDLRKYISFTSTPAEQNVLAIRSFLWTSLNPNTPYLDLPSIGWDPTERSGRGIEQNRYRGKTLIYYEMEYRKDITKNGLLGFVIFGNINSTTNAKNKTFNKINPAGGFGARIKFNKATKTNITIDYGFSSSNSGVWLGLGEAF
jgi:hypothetical protein